MGWFGGGKKKEQEKVEAKEQNKNNEEVVTANGGSSSRNQGIPSGDLKGESVIEVLRPEPSGPLPTNVSVFEFGTAGADGDDKLTLAGYCPVSDEMEPCRWEVYSAGQGEAPGFWILF